MKTITGHTTFLIDVLDPEGYPIGRAVAVEVDYVTEYDTDYGSDADGRRGVPWQTTDLLDVNIPAKTLLGLTSSEVEQILATVKSQLQRRAHA